MPTKLSIIRPEWAERVIPPPYDSMTADERRRFGETHPDSFVHVTRSPDGGHGHPTEHVRLAARTSAALDRLVSAGAFEEQSAASLYVQRIETRDGVQHSLIGVVEANGGTRLVPHESVHPGRARALAAHFSAARSMSSPIMVTVHGRRLDSTLFQPARDDDALLDQDLPDGANVKVWKGPPSPVDLGDAVYIVDGHHRAAAAFEARLDRVLVAVVAADDLIVRPFHRTVDELAMMPRRVIEQLRPDFDVTPVRDSDQARPRRSGEVGLRLGTEWFRLERRDRRTDLDAEVAHERILEGALGLDGFEDQRLGYVPGIGAPPEAPVVVLLHPVDVGVVMRRADAGGVMPPKSTYVVPKLRSGIFVVPC